MILRKRIYEILADLGDEMRKYILCNYERMGLTSEFKKSKYALIVITLLNMIETSYRNSIDGLTKGILCKSPTCVFTVGFKQSRM